MTVRKLDNPSQWHLLCVSSGATAALNILAGNSKQNRSVYHSSYKFVVLDFVKKMNIMLLSSLFNVPLPNGMLINVYDII